MVGEPGGGPPPNGCMVLGGLALGGHGAVGSLNTCVTPPPRGGWTERVGGWVGAALPTIVLQDESFPYFPPPPPGGDLPMGQLLHRHLSLTHILTQILGQECLVLAGAGLSEICPCPAVGFCLRNAPAYRPLWRGGAPAHPAGRPSGPVSPRWRRRRSTGARLNVPNSGAGRI